MCLITTVRTLHNVKAAGLWRTGSKQLQIPVCHFMSQLECFLFNAAKFRTDVHEAELLSLGVK